MARLLYVTGLLLATFSAAYGFYILARREEMPLVPEETEPLPIQVSDFPEFSVWPEDVVVEDEEEDVGGDDDIDGETIERALRLQELIQNQKRALELAAEYDQALRPEDFTEQIVSADELEPNRNTIYLID